MRVSRFLTCAVTLFVLVTFASQGITAQGSVRVVPDEGSSTAVENTPANQVTFTITNAATNDDHADVFELECRAVGAVSSCAVSTGSVYLEAREQATVTVTYTAQAPGQGVVSLFAWGTTWRGYDPAFYVIAVQSAGTR